MLDHSSTGLQCVAHKVKQTPFESRLLLRVSLSVALFPLLHHGLRMGDKVQYFAFAALMMKERLNKPSAKLKTIAKLEASVVFPV